MVLGIQTDNKNKDNLSTVEDVDSMLLLETEPIRRFFHEAATIPDRTKSLISGMGELSKKYPKSWLLLNLLFFEELSVDEIVEAGGGRVTKEQIRKDKHRALARLRKILNGYPYFNDEIDPEGKES